MAQYVIKCCECGYRAQKEPVYKCPVCGNIMEFLYDFDRNPYRLKNGASGIFRFDRVLPVEGNDAEVSLGEGDTPVIRSGYFDDSFHLKNIFYKLESCNPSGSFKDRAMAVAVSWAKQKGIHGMIIASSGNASAAAAAYAARAGIKLIAVVPENTPINKVMQVLIHGGRILKVSGDFSRSYEFCQKLAQELGWFNLTTTFLNPYAREGYKTVGYEIFEQQKEAIPEWIFVPTGDGPLLAAIYQAFRELKQMGYIRKIPRMVCVQAENCSPIVHGFHKEISCNRLRVDIYPTIASGINDSLRGYEEDGDYTIKCIRDSAGTVISLKEEEIEESVLCLARDGIFAEPAGAVAAAAIRRFAEAGKIRGEDKVLGIVTGHGLKNPLSMDTGDIPVVTDVKAALKAIGD